MDASPSETKFLNSVHLQMEGCDEPQNLDNSDAVSRGILQTGMQNLAKFSAENCGP